MKSTQLRSPLASQKRASRRAQLGRCSALPTFAALSTLWQSWQPWSTWVAALAAASAVFLALKRVFDTPSRAYDANVGDVYDDWTNEGVLEYFWGEHIHLGYYNGEEQQKAWKQPIWTGRYPKDFKKAKFDFIDEMLAWSQADEPASILDVGCGIGGTTRHLAARFPDAKVKGEFILPELVVIFWLCWCLADSVHGRNVKLTDDLAILHGACMGVHCLWWIYDVG